MRIHGKEKRQKEMVSIPKSLVRLLPDLLVRSGVDHEHAKEHDMASDTACFAVVNLHGRLRTDLISFNVEEANLSSACGNLARSDTHT